MVAAGSLPPSFPIAPKRVAWRRRMTPEFDEEVVFEVRTNRSGRGRAAGPRAGSRQRLGLHGRSLTGAAREPRPRPASPPDPPAGRPRAVHFAGSLQCTWPPPVRRWIALRGLQGAPGSRRGRRPALLVPFLQGGRVGCGTRLPARRCDLLSLAVAAAVAGPRDPRLGRAGLTWGLFSDELCHLGGRGWQEEAGGLVA